MHVRAYLRVSTEEQAEEGFSLPTQRRRIEDFCRSQWGELPDLTWYVDDGYSAKDTNRPQITALRQDAAPGDTVVVLRLDRLTRSVLDLHTLLKEWDDRGIFFRSVTEPYDTHKPEGRFMLGLLALLAEWERLRISERVREVMLNTVRSDRRHLSKPPLGYDLVAGQLRVNPAEAPVVQEVFRLYTGGMGTRAIALELNRRGLRTKQGSLWTDFAVAYTLRNPVYTGKVAWQRIQCRGKRHSGDSVLVMGEHTPLVTPELWESAAHRLGSRRQTAPRTGTGQHPLTGLLRCGLCGAPVHGVIQRRYAAGRALPGRQRRYYRCSRRERHKACSLPYLPAEALEAAVLRALPPLAPPERLREIVAALGGAAPPSDEAQALRADLRRCERALRRWDEAYAAEDITRPEWRQRTEPLRSRRHALQARLKEADPTETAPSPGALAAALSDLPRLWAALGSPATQRLLLRAFLREVTVTPDGGVIVKLLY